MCSLFLPSSDCPYHRAGVDKDRLTRFGFEQFCQRHAYDIVVLKQEHLSPEEELVPDLWTSPSARMRKRSGEQLLSIFGYVFGQLLAPLAPKFFRIDSVAW